MAAVQQSVGEITFWAESVVRPREGKGPVPPVLSLTVCAVHFLPVTTGMLPPRLPRWLKRAVWDVRNFWSSIPTFDREDDPEAAGYLFALFELCKLVRRRSVAAARRRIRREYKGRMRKRMLRRFNDGMRLTAMLGRMEVARRRGALAESADE